MTWVKVCGLTRRQDVEAAVEAGADAVGFVIAPESPRRTDPAAVAELAAGIDVVRVLVTVDLGPAALIEAVEVAGVDGVQPHGLHADVAAAAGRDLGLFVLRPVAVRDYLDLPPLPSEMIPLLDTYRPGRHGGTGETFDWELAERVPGPFVMAGGLGPDNVAAAVRLVQPWGVDASSRLEAAVGIKDHGKVTAFVREAKQA
jgi:phosphoribosylanthranilate isomerase